MECVGGNTMILILYSSKYGTTKTCVDYLITKINKPCTVATVETCKDINLNTFDTVIIGSSIYAGKIHKQLRQFCVNHNTLLATKKLGLFIVGANEPTTHMDLFESNYHSLANVSKINQSFGGELLLDKMNFFEKFIIRMVTKNKMDTPPCINYTNIDKFADSVNTL